MRWIWIGVAVAERREQQHVGQQGQDAEGDQHHPAAFAPLADDLPDEDEAGQGRRESGADARPRCAARPVKCLQDVLADGQAHHHDRHEHAHAVEGDCQGGLAAHQEHDQDGQAKGDGDRAGEGAARVAVDDDLRDLADGHIPPFGGLGVLEGRHRGGRQQQHGQELVGPEENFAARDLAEADEARLPTRVRPACRRRR